MNWFKKEIPPSAGLPPQWADLAPIGRTLEADIARFLRLEELPQMECSGTAALIITLTTLKRNSGRHQVILPAYSCPLAALAVLHSGLTPVLCDVRPGHFDFCPTQLASLSNQNTLAIIPTHLGGRVADLHTTMQIAANCGATVIENAAQSLGARWQGQAVGTAGNAGFYSLAAGNGLTTYKGGVLLARDIQFRQQLRNTHHDKVVFSLAWELQQSLGLLGYTLLYRPHGLHLSYGMRLRHALRRNRLSAAVGDDFSANIPLHTLGYWRKSVAANAFTRLPWFLAQLSAQATRRKSMLTSIPGVTLMDDAPGNQGTWPYFMLLLPSEQARDAALESLWSDGLGVSRLFIHALPDYPYLKLKVADSPIPNARDFAARMLTVSNSLWLGDADFARICEKLSRQKIA